MKPRLRWIILLLCVFATYPTLAGEPAGNLFRDLADRLKAAVGTKGVNAVMVLYQTNAVPAVEFAGEVARWQRVLADDAQGKLSFFGKEAATLPPESQRFWSDYVQRLTKHQVTHVIMLRFGGGVQFVLPIVSTEGKLWIVPSEKNPPSIEPSGPANRSQPVRPQTNQPPAS